MGKKRISKAARGAISRANKRPSLAAMGALGVTALPGIIKLMEPIKPEWKMNGIIEIYTGYDPGQKKWDWRKPVGTYGPGAVLLIGKKVASKFKLLNGVFKGLPFRA